MTRRSGCILGLAILLGMLCTGCRTTFGGALAGGEPAAEASAAAEGTPPFLLPAEALAETFVMRQTVTVRWADEDGRAQEASFEAAVQRQGKSLLLLGLGPMGGVGFTLSLEAGKVSFENRTGQELPFAPERMLADVQRVYYPWLDGASPCRDCVRRGTRGGFRIEEHRAQGQVSRRRFEPLETGREVRSGEEEDEEQGDEMTRLGIEVRYSGGPAFGGLLRDATLRHEEFGYEIEMKTLGLDWID